MQTQIRVGNLGIKRSDVNFIPVAVMNRIFGGGYNSRLNTEVRVKSGLTYGAYSSFNPHRFTGSFGVGTFTRTDATVAGHEAGGGSVDEDVEWRDNAGRAEFRARLSGGRVSDSVGDGGTGGWARRSLWRNLICRRTTTIPYPDRIRGVTPEQVKQMAQKILADERYRHRAGGKCSRVSRRAEEGVTERAVHGDSVRSGRCAGD